MLRAVVIGAVVGATGCFSPSFSDGVIACGQDDACPPGLVCSRGLCTSDPQADEPDQPDGAVIVPDAAPPDAAPPATLAFPAAIADCTSPQEPNPDLCEESVGTGQMNVDLDTAGIAFHAFVRFDIGTEIANRNVTSVTLVLTASDDPNADGVSSGEVWRVESFDRAALFVEVPAKLGDNPVSPEQGAVEQNQPVSWSLPPGLVSAGQPVFLGVFALSSSGVNYWNNGGDVPPLLSVAVE